MTGLDAHARTVREGARPAQPADLPGLAALCGQALEEIASWRGGELFAANEARPAPYDLSLARDLADGQHTIWVGTLNDHVFGYSAGRATVLRDGRRIGVITDLYVEPGARRVGVAAAMMTGVLGWFAAQGCVAVDGEAMPGDRLTKNFFESWGFTARRIVMHHRLDDSRPDDFR